MKRIKSKVPLIKKLINFEDAHPGSISSQRYTRKDGTKSKKYYIWQSSYRGKKKSVRFTEDDLYDIKKLISSTKQDLLKNKKKGDSLLKAYTKSIDDLNAENKKIRQQNAEKDEK